MLSRCRWRTTIAAIAVAGDFNGWIRTLNQDAAALTSLLERASTGQRQLLSIESHQFVGRKGQQHTDGLQLGKHRGISTKADAPKEVIDQVARC